MKQVVLCIIVLLALSFVVEGRYYVETQRSNRGRPIITKSNSVFDYNYNAAYVPPSRVVPKEGLLVRCQNNDTERTHDIYSVTPSVLAFTRMTANESESGGFAFEPITKDSVVFSPTGEDEVYGVEDPRMIFVNNTYYLLYSAVRYMSNKVDVQSMLALATTPDPTVPNQWKRHGALFPEIPWTKSGSLLIRDSAPHYLFFGDSTLVPGLQYAITYDLIHYKLMPGVWLPTRPGMFDADLVEGGPHPLRMRDGNYFMVYNSARHYKKTVKPGYDFQYNLGWVVLNGTNPTQILQRSSEPILSPDLVWETGESRDEWFGLTPNVVFGEGWRYYQSETDNDADQIVLFYGGADTHIGSVVITVRNYEK